MAENILQIKELTITVKEQRALTTLVDRVSFDVPALSTTALVGGSGSGKTTIGLSILGLLPLGLAIQTGEIIFNGTNLCALRADKYRQMRGRDISMIFQEPLQAFNPVLTVGEQIEEVLVCHTEFNKKQRLQRVLELLATAGLNEPLRAAGSYPHQLSGGMRQRAMIAQALAGEPQLIIADEPTSSLDVTLQAKIIELFQKLQKEFRLSIILISHDIGMVAHMADHVVVLNQGKVVEAGQTAELMEKPQHPYTQKLLKVSQ